MGKYSDCLCIWLCVFIVFVFVIVFVFDLHFKVLIGNLSSEVGEAGASKVREGVAASLMFHFSIRNFFISFLSSGQFKFWAQTFYLTCVSSQHCASIGRSDLTSIEHQPKTTCDFLARVKLVWIRATWTNVFNSINTGQLLLLCLCNTGCIRNCLCDYLCLCVFLCL